MTGGYIFSLSTIAGGGGYPGQVQIGGGGTLARSRWGVPWPGPDGGTPARSRWGGTLGSPTRDGVPPPSGPGGGTQARSRWGALGYPPLPSGMEYPLPGMGYPPPPSLERSFQISLHDRVIIMRFVIRFAHHTNMSHLKMEGGYILSRSFLVGRGREK